MKRIILLSLMFALSFAMVHATEEAEMTIASDPELVQYDIIITDCGTVHQVAPFQSNEALLRLLDYFTEMDCL